MASVPWPVLFHITPVRVLFSPLRVLFLLASRHISYAAYDNGFLNPSDDGEAEHVCGLFLLKISLHGKFDNFPWQTNFAKFCALREKLQNQQFTLSRK